MVNTWLLPFAPILLAILAAVYWWAGLSSPWLFLVTAVLSLLGIQVLVSLVWEYMPIVTGNYFLEAPSSEAHWLKVVPVAKRSACVQLAIVLVTAVPFLWWLKSAFYRSANI